MTTDKINWSDFEKVEMRVGTILQAEVFKEAKKPAYKLILDFGEFGIRKSSAQITQLYSTEELIGLQVVAVVNFPNKQIANIQSECLVLSCVGSEEGITLLTPERKVKNGSRIA